MASHESASAKHRKAILQVCCMPLKMGQKTGQNVIPFLELFVTFVKPDVQL